MPTPVNKNSEEARKKRTPFAVVEAYNTIRTNLLFLLSQYKSKTITISSSNAGEGKSTTALNIAIAFSQLGSKTLLVDCDLRKPTVHKKLHINADKGITNVLVGFADFDEAVYSVNPNFDVFTAGSTPPNPSELLAGEAFDAFLKQAESKYDYIIIDTPPVNVVSDALTVGQKTAGILLVVRDRITYLDDIKSAVSSIEFANIRILGTVLNGTIVKTENKRKYRSKYGSYGYGYGYGYSSYGRNYEQDKPSEK